METRGRKKKEEIFREERIEYGKKLIKFISLEKNLIGSFLTFKERKKRETIVKQLESLLTMLNISQYTKLIFVQLLNTQKIESGYQLKVKDEGKLPVNHKNLKNKPKIIILSNEEVARHYLDHHQANQLTKTFPIPPVFPNEENQYEIKKIYWELENPIGS